MPENEAAEKAWYAVHTYSGYENKVKDSLEKTVEHRGLGELISEVRIPVEKVVEIKNNKRHIAQRKIFPGYVLVRMVMTDDTWYVVRNTRGVTGFVGPGSKPSPLSEEEIKRMGADTDAAIITNSFEVGDEVTIMEGTLEAFTGKVVEVDYINLRLRVTVSLFGRDTQVELDFNQVRKI